MVKSDLLTSFQGFSPTRPPPPPTTPRMAAQSERERGKYSCVGEDRERSFWQTLTTSQIWKREDKNRPK